MYHGMINIYKEAGCTSHDVVARLRRILGQKKIGHTGTLDPDAVGVLPVCLGAGTRLCDMLADEKKEYVAGFRFGITTDTQDMSGTVLSRQEATVTERQAAEIVESFLGVYEQIPPMYSALKVNGRKLYELAREGLEVERKARSVRIEEIEILQTALPFVRMRVVCSKGTYIRTLCDDIGKKAGCGAVMESLERTRVGRFRAEDALTLSDVEKMLEAGRLEEFIVQVEEMFPALRRIRIREHYQKQLENGNCLALKMTCGQQDMNDAEQVRVYSTQGIFYGIYRYEERTETLFPVKMFLMR
ncbi:MAG: tRNA pseudouridine(55) synthase TruB [Blautia sp.]|nr:tRNA pseudouridine(55) synthase TruB [Blautia sp.]MCM1201885.1 tRNA pseudouridine(55) synthase TruB [Bacteroides fragilis]